MNFKDIHIDDINKFLKKNRINNHLDVYTEAINLICHDCVMTQPVKNWLTAYHHKDLKLNNHLSDYQKVLDEKLTIDDVNQILYYLGHKTNHIDLLTNDLMYEILRHVFLSTSIRCLSKSLYHRYKQIVATASFKKSIGELILDCKKYKNNQFDLRFFDIIYPKTFNTPAGKMIKLKNIENKVFYISENYQLYILKNKTWYIGMIDMPIHDIGCDPLHGYFYLSSGRIYTGKVKKMNCFTFKARTKQFISSTLLPSTYSDDIISIENTRLKVYFLRANGERVDV